MAKGHAGGLSREECESRGTLLELLDRYPDEESCERRLLEEKYPGGFVCPARANTQPAPRCTAMRTSGSAPGAPASSPSPQGR
jgi:hypothetical protein